MEESCKKPAKMGIFEAVKWRCQALYYKMFYSRMEKKLMRIVVALVVVIVVLLLVVGFFVYKLTSGLAESRALVKLADGEVVLDAPERVLIALDEGVIENYSNLKTARAILTQISSLTDVRGFYGWEQLCGEVGSGGSDCRLSWLVDHSGDLYASHRETIAVVWARYQYFAATGDARQLQLLENDLDNLLGIVDDRFTWSIQSDMFNCLLMRDLVTSPYLPPSVQNKALRLCNQVAFETHPESMVAHDQHRHTPYVFLSGGVNPYTVVWEENRKVSEQNYDSESLVKDIGQMLYDHVGKGITPGVAYNVPPEEQTALFRREVMAALDQAAARELNLERNLEQASKNELDYLLLSAETLSWYMNGSNYEEENRCLLNENVRYFLDHFDHGLAADEVQAVREFFAPLARVKVSEYCLLAANTLNGEPAIKAEEILAAIADYNQNLGLADSSRGYFNLKEGQLAYYIYLNGIVAGLLSER